MHLPTPGTRDGTCTSPKARLSSSKATWAATKAFLHIIIAQQMYRQLDRRTNRYIPHYTITFFHHTSYHSSLRPSLYFSKTRSPLP